jgi:hypothetical protein
MSHSRFYARPQSYMTGPGDPRGGAAGSSADGRTVFRYQLAGGQWGASPFIGDPVRYDGRPYVSQLQMIPQVGIPEGTIVEVVDGFGQLDTYEFRSDGGPVQPGNIEVAYAPAATAADVATAFRNAGNSFGTAHVTFSIQPTSIVQIGQNDGSFGGRTGFSPATGGVGVVRSQTLPAVFSPTLIQTGYDPVEVLPGRVGKRPVLICTQARPLFIVT